MGDTGSLALGGLVAVVGMILKRPLLIIIVGGIYVLEALSDVIQVTSYKLTRKRVFKMAPIHHHFELSGWHETKVVAVFSIATVVLCLIGFVINRNCLGGYLCQSQNKKIGNIDFVLFATLMLLVAIGIVMVYSSSSYVAYFDPTTHDSMFYLKSRYCGLL